MQDAERYHRTVKLLFAREFLRTPTQQRIGLYRVLPQNYHIGHDLLVQRFRPAVRLRRTGQARALRIHAGVIDVGRRIDRDLTERYAGYQDRYLYRG